MEAMLREVYGESFVDSPTAALTLKRVKGKPRRRPPVDEAKRQDCSHVRAQSNEIDDSDMSAEVSGKRLGGGKKERNGKNRS